MNESADLAAVIALVRALPSRVQSLRVKTSSWSDIDLAMVASDRGRNLLARSAPGRLDSVSQRIERRSVLSWMELSEASWNRPGFDVLPRRWRAEAELTRLDGTVVRFVSALDDDRYWSDHGDGVKAIDARTMTTSVENAWVIGTRWIDAPVHRELLGTAAVLGRPVTRVRIVPRPGVRWSAQLFHAGDAHEVAVDRDTGMLLAVTSFVDDAPCLHCEVVDIELNGEIAADLTAVPAGAETAPASRGVRTPHDVAGETSLAVLSPTRVPSDFTFQTGGARVHDDGEPSVSLIFSKERHEFITLYETPDTPLLSDPYEWEHVRRGDRTVSITDVTDATGTRIAHTSLDGTRVVIYAALPARELLDVAFSLERVEP